MSAKKPAMPNMLATNDKARFDYEILETLEAGLVLTGQEVKSAKSGQMKLKGAHVAFTGDEAWLLGSHIPKYLKAGRLDGYDPERSRKLLLKRQEIARLRGKSDEEGMTVVPLKCYLKRGRIKVELGVGRGKKKHDKRETIKKRDVERDIRRAMRLKG